MSETPAKFGERLELAMQLKGWNQTMLAAKAGVGDPTVSRHLERDDPPKPESIEKYRVALGNVSSEWLAYGRGAMIVVPGNHDASRTMLAGSHALETVLASYAWPDVDIEIVDAVVSDARTEASKSGADRPESVWSLRIGQLLRERTGRAKSVPQRAPATTVDLTQESPEIQAVRKRPRRL